MSDETIHSRVVFRKQVSDGNYGTETAEVVLDVLSDMDDGSWNTSSVRACLELARRLVHEELARSPSANVRRALETN
jgi:hypothetical protein